MTLVRVLIPLALFIFLVHIIASAIISGIKERKIKESEGSKKEPVGMPGIDEIISNLKISIETTKLMAEDGIKGAEADLISYKKDLEQLEKLKENSKNL